MHRVGGLGLSGVDASTTPGAVRWGLVAKIRGSSTRLAARESLTPTCYSDCWLGGAQEPARRGWVASR